MPVTPHRPDNRTFSDLASPRPSVGEGQGEGKTGMPINLTAVAKDLRKCMTDAERVLWQRLKAKQFGGLKFRRQEQIGRFIADFVCFERGIIIEADGGQHAIEREKDEERTQWLNSQGFTVLRFWNYDILTNIESVMEAIRSACVEAPFPRPSPTLTHRSASARRHEGRGR
jgi:very-short-patch-repair endonuclease